MGGVEWKELEKPRRRGLDGLRSKVLLGRCHRNTFCDAYNALTPLSPHILPYGKSLPTDNDFGFSSDLTKCFFHSSLLIFCARHFDSRRNDCFATHASLFVDQIRAPGDEGIKLLLQAQEAGCKPLCRSCVLRIARCGRAAHLLREFSEVDHGAVDENDDV
jgi:hypothetical protein